MRSYVGCGKLTLLAVKASPNGDFSPESDRLRSKFMPAGALPKPRKGGNALRAYALYQVDVASRALGCNAARLHIGIHEARKAMRRTRAALDLGEANAEFGVAGSNELKLMCRRLSDARDAYIIVKTAEKLARGTGDARAASLQRLLDRFERAHQRRIARLAQTDPGLRRLRARLSILRARIAALPWASLGELEVRHAIETTARRVERAARKARTEESGEVRKVRTPANGDVRKTRAQEDGEARHRWRRRLRRLRYQIEIAENELGVDGAAAAARFVSGASAARLAEMTDLLGDEHDLRLVLAAMSSPRSATPRNDDFATTQRQLLKAIEEKADALRP
jgi:CHAD domain-containing protein